MTRTEFLLARRKYSETRSLFRIGLIFCIVVVVLLTSRYAPGTKAERPHIAIVVVEIVAVLMGFRFVDKVRARHLIAAHRLICPPCGANLIADGGRHAMLHGRCANCHKSLFENGRDFESTLATGVNTLTRSQYLMHLMASEQFSHPVVELFLAYLALIFPLTAFWAIVRYPDSREFLGIGVIGQFLMASFMLLVFDRIGRIWYRRFVRSPSGLPPMSPEIVLDARSIEYRAGWTMPKMPNRGLRRRPAGPFALVRAR